MYHTIEENQTKFPDSQENLAPQTNGVIITTAPIYNDTVPVYEKDIEELVSRFSCNGRLSIINVLINRIGWRGFWRASHAHIAQLLGLSAVYVKKTLSRCVELGIFRSKRTFNGSNIYTLNPEFVKSGIMERLRPYFPGMRSLLSLLSLLASLPNCNYADSIHAPDGKVSTNILNVFPRSINCSYNIQSSTSEGVKIEKTTKTETEYQCKKDKIIEKVDFSSLSNVIVTDQEQNKELSLNKPPVPLPPQISQAELLRKRSKAFLADAKREQQERSPMRRYPFLSIEGVYFAVSTGMSPWEAALLAGIPAQTMISLLVKFTGLNYKTKIGLMQSSRYLKREQKSKVIYRDVIRDKKSFAWWFLRTELKKLGLTFDYALATTVRNHYGLKENKVMSMHDQSIFMKVLSGISSKLDAFQELSAEEYAKAARKAKAQEYKEQCNDRREREKIRTQHSETIRYTEFKEDGIEEDTFREDGVYNNGDDYLDGAPIMQNAVTTHKQTKQTIVVNDSPALAPVLSPQEECSKIIKDRRIALLKMPSFMYDMMKTNWTNELKIKFSFLPTDFDILTYVVE